MPKRSLSCVRCHLSGRMMPRRRNVTLMSRLEGVWRNFKEKWCYLRLRGWEALDVVPLEVFGAPD